MSKKITEADREELRRHQGGSVSVGITSWADRQEDLARSGYLLASYGTWRLTARGAAVIRFFDGKGAVELAEELGLTVAEVEQYIREAAGA